MGKLDDLFENNRSWAKLMKHSQPDFFDQLSQQQAPEYLWIGCSDSRVPANQIIGLLPGEVFVHRNVANVVVHTDLNCLSVVQFAVDVLKIKHIIVTGHYGCGGVRAALNNEKVGLADNWLRHVQDVAKKHDGLLQATEESARWNVLCELNVIEQVQNLCQTTVVNDVWERGQSLAIYGLIYGIEDGLLRDLKMCVTRPEDIGTCHQRALERIMEKSK